MDYQCGFIFGGLHSGVLSTSSEFDVGFLSNSYTISVRRDPGVC